MSPNTLKRSKIIPKWIDRINTVYFYPCGKSKLYRSPRNHPSRSKIRIHIKTTHLIFQLRRHKHRLFRSRMTQIPWLRRKVPRPFTQHLQKKSVFPFQHSFRTLPVFLIQINERQNEQRRTNTITSSLWCITTIQLRPYLISQSKRTPSHHGRARA